MRETTGAGCCALRLLVLLVLSVPVHGATAQERPGGEEDGTRQIEGDIVEEPSLEDEETSPEPPGGSAGAERMDEDPRESGAGRAWEQVEVSLQPPAPCERSSACLQEISAGTVSRAEGRTRLSAQQMAEVAPLFETEESINQEPHAAWSLVAGDGVHLLVLDDCRVFSVGPAGDLAPVERVANPPVSDHADGLQFCAAAVSAGIFPGESQLLVVRENGPSDFSTTAAEFLQLVRRGDRWVAIPRFVFDLKFANGADSGTTFLQCRLDSGRGRGVALREQCTYEYTSPREEVLTFNSTKHYDLVGSAFVSRPDPAGDRAEKAFNQKLERLRSRYENDTGGW